MFGVTGVASRRSLTRLGPGTGFHITREDRMNKLTSRIPPSCRIKYHRINYHRINYQMMMLCLVVLIVFSNAALAQKKNTRPRIRKAATAAPLSAWEHGYSGGYNDGYTSGKSDFNAKLDRDYQRGEMYQQANRGYESGYGELTEYQDGYRLGYEIAYTDGFYGRPLNAKLPPNAAAMRNGAKRVPAETKTTTSGSGKPGTGPNARTRTTALLIPDKTELKLRLSEILNTKVNKEGDRFKAKVIEPTGYEEAVVEGHIARLNRSGKLTGKTELALDFDTITMPDGRTASFRVEIIKIYATESVKSVDEEGNIETSSKTKDTQIRTAGGAALGAIIGAIAGGGKGAAIGAIVGAGAGAGSVYVQGNKDIILEPGTEMSVRTIGVQREKTSQ